ncbi:hypothetical protein ANCDUO_01061 [Ancylostoma duodenale]|uniref:SAM domain-containing protein n=1 Tax=Ancylostoma duodenale TaxID=51022 RepID=A0A0C2DF39_9BILA|nr:hypothetical protein ANCDUO_01061 [Ancylostoma duodenale]
MSVRVRFSAARPGVAYVQGERSGEGGGLAAEILGKPMPPLHKEDNFRMDAHTAASIGDANVIQALIASKKFDPNEKNLSEWTPLLYAAYLGHHNVCQILMEAGAKLDDCNRRGQTALMMAAACGNLQVVRLLLEQGASVDRADSKDRQALHYASSCSQNVVVDALLQAGADPNAADSDGMTPLLEACASGHELTTCSLLEYLPENKQDEKTLPVIIARRCQIRVTPQLTVTAKPVIHLRHTHKRRGARSVLRSFVEIRRGRDVGREDTTDAPHGGDPFIKNARGENCHAVAGEAPKILQLINEHMQRRGKPGFTPEPPATSRRPRTLEELLGEMNLLRLVDKFKAENIDLNLFFDLTEKDFEEMGIAYGPKKRMLTVIDRYRKTGQISSEPIEVDVAPPPPFAMLNVTMQTAEDGGQKEMVASMRYIRQMNDITKQLAMEALEVARRSNNGDALRPLIIGIIDSVENITTRIARHQL